MDPVKIKFLQLIGAEIFGAVLSLVGLYMFFRGITGKSDLIVEGKGVKARLTNSAPGTIICFPEHIQKSSQYYPAFQG